MTWKAQNRAETRRLETIAGRLDESLWSMSLGGGWTIGTMLCHLAYWDRMTLARLGTFRTHGRLPAVPDQDNIEAINNAVRFVSEGIAHRGAGLVVKAAHEIDDMVETLSQEELDTLEKSGRDRWFKRFLHRQMHLDRIEKHLAE